MTSSAHDLAGLMKFVRREEWTVVRGKTVRTTVRDASAPCPLDRVNRVFKTPRPNMLWLSDFTYVATWSGFVYVATR